MIYALHGFLGKPSDWKFLDGNVEKVDIFRYDPLPATIEEWAERFNESIPGEDHILIGYSLGARLALHAIHQQPKKWKAAVLISCHPGIEDQQEKLQKLESDVHWGQRFLKDPWNQLIRDWNQQSVLQSSRHLSREESHYGRDSLYHALSHWSTGTHPLFKEIDIPTLWVVGELDQKYINLSQKIKLNHPNSVKKVIPGCGHRVHIDEPNLLNQSITTFINEVSHARRS